MKKTRLQLLALTPALALVLAVGCGGGNDSSGGSDQTSAADIRLDDQAAAKAKAAADKVVQATPDKNLPGPKRYLSVCLRHGDPEASDVPVNSIKCHIEAFYKNYRGTPGGYIWSEDWLIPIQNGKLGTPASRATTGSGTSSARTTRRTARGATNQRNASRRAWAACCPASALSS